MATRNTVVTRGARSLDDRGGPSKSGGGRLDKAPVSVSNVKSHEIALQSRKTGLIVQLTADGDRVNELSGVRIKGEPLYLNFTEHGGFLKLNFDTQKDRRRWIYVVGSEQAARDFKSMGVTHKPDPKDGDDPIPPHPRFGLGKSFWKLTEMQEAAAQTRRRALLDQLAQDKDLQEFVLKNPKDLAEHLARRKEELSNPELARARKKAAQQPKPAEDDSDEGEGGDGDGTV